MGQRFSLGLSFLNNQLNINIPKGTLWGWQNFGPVHGATGRLETWAQSLCFLTYCLMGWQATGHSIVNYKQISKGKETKYSETFNQQNWTETRGREDFPEQQFPTAILTAVTLQESSEG